MYLKKSAVIAIAVLLSFASKANGITFKNITLAKALELSKAESKPIFIDIYATWCGPCKYLSKEVFVDEELGAFMNENFINIKLDGEEEEGDQLMMDFGLNAYPTMLFLSGDREELHRIVGAVGASEILEAGKGVIDPESTEIFQMNAKYEAGNRDKAFLLEYIPVLISADGDSEPIVAEYMERYPDIDLENEDEFFVFCLGDDALNNPLNKTFIKDIATYNELHPELTLVKLKILLFGVGQAAKEAQDMDLIDEGIDQLLPPFEYVFDGDVSRDELTEVLLDIYLSKE